VFEQFEVGVGVDQVREVDQQEGQEAPADQRVQDAGSQPETKNGLEESDLDDQFSNPFGNEGPVHLPLAAADVPDDAFHAAPGVVQGCKPPPAQRGFFSTRVSMTPP
jgi:hypothetical protein